MNPDAIISPTLDPATLAELVDHFLLSTESVPSRRFSLFEGRTIQPDLLTDDHVVAIKFVTFIEDHIPGYVSEYLKLFPVDGSVSADAYLHNRELYRFVLRWAMEEDTHAHMLAQYQVKAGLSTPAELRQNLAMEGRKFFETGYQSPAAVFTYTLIQEKATQLFYQQFARVVREPVLKDLLQNLVRDEARHYAFFARLMEGYLSTCGAPVLGEIKDVLRQFRMPLSNTLKGYWRTSLRISDAVAFDHTEAYEALERLVRHAADAPSRAGATEIVELIRTLRSHGSQSSALT